MIYHEKQRKTSMHIVYRLYEVYCYLLSTFNSHILMTMVCVFFLGPEFIL
jgi:hypothetical protein